MIKDWCVENCPYHPECGGRDMCNHIDSLLKEQEPVKPLKEHSGSGVTWWNVCGVCRTAINPNDKFCHECGRAVLWE